MDGKGCVGHVAFLFHKEGVGWGGGGAGPGIMQNRARQPEPALQRVVKQKRAGRRAQRPQAATFLPLRNISDKAQWE